MEGQFNRKPTTPGPRDSVERSIFIHEKKPTYRHGLPVCPGLRVAKRREREKEKVRHLLQIRHALFLAVIILIFPSLRMRISGSTAWIAEHEM